MVALSAVTNGAEVLFAAAAIVLLVAATFGLDAKAFRKKREERQEGTAPGAPKRRIHYVVVDEPEEPNSEIPTRPEH